MPSRFEAYRLRDGLTPLSERTFNPIFADLDLRLGALEALHVSWETAVQRLTDLGLDRLNAVLTPLLATVEQTAQGEIAQLQAAIEAQITTIESTLADFSTATNDQLAALQGQTDAAIAEVSGIVAQAQALLAQIEDVASQAELDAARAELEALAAGALPGWSMTPSGGSAEQPAQLLYANGQKQIKAALTWSAGGAVTEAVYSRSENGGTGWTAIGTQTITYDANDNVTGVTWV